MPCNFNFIHPKAFLKITFTHKDNILDRQVSENVGSQRARCIDFKDLIIQ